ncbi:unnamed protein product [Cylindrotheca closterium]|uniref:Orc1-like AAA ATPase domain-containing protein n=1 Tax=Cylindrotheca closterium TaxID=2856 RepID=A0AAD2JG99_9STRA|nr:unnamed protein product [Cylindrotheca closterium]
MKENVIDSDAASITASSLRTSVTQRSNETPMVRRPSRMSKLAQARLSELTINKLKIHSVGMIGREKETELLRIRLRTLIQQANDATDDGENAQSHNNGIQTSKVKKELVLIRGFAGVGKTTLARTISKDVNSTANGFFAEGKFDLDDDRDQPYSGIAKAYSGLIQELWRTDRDMLLKIGKQLSEDLGSEVEPLTFMIPELEDAVIQQSTSSFSEGGMEGLQDRWKYSFRLLTRLLSAQMKPLVLLIDDLQWADPASLDLIECLITDTQNVNPLMVIGCYRSNEVNEDSNLSKTMESLMDRKLDFGFDISEVAVESFGGNEVNQMVMKMMDIDDEESTRDLAELCFQRTLGNPFFVIEFMSMLQREDLVTFNLGTMKWSYDIRTIADTTVSTANVVELLESRMQKMPADVRLLLQLVACLGPTWRVPIVETLWKNLAIVQSKGFEVVAVSTLIEYIEGEMLVEGCGGVKYRWVHDKVQEAAISLVETDERTMKFEMGKLLYLNLQGKELDDGLFDVTDLISNGVGGQSPDFASLCLKAGKRAMRLSAFLSSTRYVKNGIGMLPDNCWTTLQSLTLELYTLGAEVELALGHVEESKNYCSAVLSQDDIELSAKIPLRIIEIRRLSTVEIKYSETVKTCLALLKDMKYKFIWSRRLITLQAVSTLSSTIKAVKKQPKDFYLNPKRMDDRYKTIVEILNRLQYSSFHTQNIMQLILCSCHIVQLTLKHGLCEYSAKEIATLGNLEILVFQRRNNAAMFRELALSTQSHFGRPRACQAIFNVHAYSMVWLVPMQQCKEIYYEAYIKGMRNGEVDYAMWCLAYHFGYLPYVLGKPIDQIVGECPNVTMAMEEVSQTSQANAAKCYWQMWIILQNPQPNGYAISLKGEIHSIEACAGDPFLLAVHDYIECQLLLFYDDPSAADRAISGAKVFSKISPGVPDVMIETFHRGICLYVAARRTMKRKYKQHAIKIRKQIHKWKKDGVVNVVDYCIFLDAEHAALEGKYEEAESHYKKAIQFVARSGHLHHAGLFNELYSDFLWRERNDKEEARYHLQEAMRYYNDWGAYGVVERLRKSRLLE